MFPQIQWTIKSQKHARSCDRPTTMPPPCHPSHPNGHETNDFLHVAINILNWFVAFFVWDLTTILIYCLKALGLLAQKKTNIFQPKKWMLTPLTSPTLGHQLNLRLPQVAAWELLKKSLGANFPRTCRDLQPGFHRGFIGKNIPPPRGSTPLNHYISIIN